MPHNESMASKGEVGRLESLRPNEEVRRFTWREFEKPVLVLMWLAGCYLLFVTVSYYLGFDRIGGDAHAYWLTGQSWYTPYRIAPNRPDAYLYSPAFAQIIRPLTWLPWPVFATVWISAETTAFAWLLRPLGWRWVGPLVLWCAPELVIGNVLGLLAVALVVSFAHPWSWSAMVLTKPVFCVGALWFAVRGEWRRFAVAVGTTLVIVVASFAFEPHLWVVWMRFLLEHSRGSTWFFPGRILLAGVLVVVAARTDRRWLLPFALLMATPVLAGSPSLTILAALPRLTAGTSH